MAKIHPPHFQVRITFRDDSEGQSSSCVSVGNTNVPTRWWHLGSGVCVCVTAMAPGIHLSGGFWATGFVHVLAHRLTPSSASSPQCQSFCTAWVLPARLMGRVQEEKKGWEGRSSCLAVEAGVSGGWHACPASPTQTTSHPRMGRIAVPTLYILKLSTILKLNNSIALPVIKVLTCIMLPALLTTTLKVGIFFLSFVISITPASRNHRLPQGSLHKKYKIQ